MKEELLTAGEERFAVEKNEAEESTVPTGEDEVVDVEAAVELDERTANGFDDGPGLESALDPIPKLPNERPKFVEDEVPNVNGPAVGAAGSGVFTSVLIMRSSPSNSSSSSSSSDGSKQDGARPGSIVWARGSNSSSEPEFLSSALGPLDERRGSSSKTVDALSSSTLHGDVLDKGLDTRLDNSSPDESSTSSSSSSAVAALAASSCTPADDVRGSVAAAGADVWERDLRLDNGTPRGAADHSGTRGGENENSESADACSDAAGAS